MIVLRLELSDVKKCIECPCSKVGSGCSQASHARHCSLVKDEKYPKLGRCISDYIEYGSEEPLIPEWCPILTEEARKAKENIRLQMIENEIISKHRQI